MKINLMFKNKVLKGHLTILLFILILLMSGHISAFAQGTQIDFNTIPKSGTALMYAHLDDDLIWMLPFWKITEKFIGGNEPKTPAYEAIIHEQQVYLNNNGYNINYESNWMTPWGILTNNEYRGYYDSNAPEYQYLAVDHLLSYWDNNDDQLVRKEINKIKAKIEQYIASLDVSRVITHDNWGEYGHQHHKALNKAVRELAVKYRKDVWMLGSQVVSGNFIDVDVPNGITYTLGSFDDPSLYSAIRSIYQNIGRWTYVYDQVPSGDHKFIKIVERGIDKSNILTGESVTTSGSYQDEPGAYIFDGDDDYLTLQGNNNSSFTIAMRIRPDLIREMDISAMSEYPLSTKNDRNLYLNSDGRITARIYDGSSEVTTSTALISANAWTHIAITGNASSLKLYINGTLDKTISAGTAITDYSTPEFILGQATETGTNFKGQINDVRFYDHVLTDSEIAALSGMVYTIASSAGAGGAIEPSGNVSVGVGTNKTYTIIPETGFKISDVTVDNISAGAVSTYTFTNITSDHTISAAFTPSATHIIISSAGTGGSISPPGTRVVNEGANQTYTITPVIGYRVSDVKADGVSVGAITSYTFSNILSDHTISVVFETAPTYTIETSAGVGGSITPGGSVILNEGTSQSFIIKPCAGYRISDVLADGASVGSVTSYSFSHVTSNHTISATFTLLTFTVTGSAGAGGSISPSGILTVNYGSSHTYSISPNTGYQISNVLVDNVAVGTPSVYTFNTITASHTIAVSFSLITNTITASAGTGGTISPQGNISLNYGSDQTFTISASTGYHVSDVKVDNVSVGAVSSYNFVNVTAGHTISATFTQITYVITGSAGTGGSINPSGNIIVNYGSNRTFTVSPDFGFKVADVKADNVSAGAVSTYTFSNITTDHTISATFTTATYSITAGAGSGGSINPSGVAIVTHGTNHTYTITPVTGYKISDVKVDNVTVGNVSSYTFSNITSNHSISATFAILTYTLSSFAGTGGSVSSSGINTVDYGSNKTFTITPNTGYYISDVKVDNTSIGSVSSYTFSNVTSNHSISATFSLITFKLTCEAGAGGSVTPAGTLTVNYGSSSAFTITPDTGFLISDVKIDHVSAGAISSYTFSNVTSDHKISAEFTPITFTIKSDTKSGGSISPPGIVTVNYGTDQTFSITPDTGYQIDDVFIDNKSVGPISSFAFIDIKGDHDISASFSVIKYTISIDANTGGSVNPNGKTIVNFGEKLTCNFVPDYGYKIFDVKVDNISSGAVSSYSFNNITADHNISVTFILINTYSIIATPGTGGSITPSGSVTLFEGSDQTYEITPSRDYRILDVVVDNYSLGAINEFTFSNITSNHTLSVRFTTSIDVKAYPNPFVEEINTYIASPEGSLFDMSVSDLNGKIIYVQNKTPGNTVLPLNLAVPKGLYFLRIYLRGKKIAIIKVVKS